MTSTRRTRRRSNNATHVFNTGIILPQGLTERPRVSRNRKSQLLSGRAARRYPIKRPMPPLASKGGPTTTTRNGPPAECTPDDRRLMPVAESTAAGLNGITAHEYPGAARYLYVGRPHKLPG